MIWGERWFFVLLILVELLKLSFHYEEEFEDIKEVVGILSTFSAIVSHLSQDITRTTWIESGLLYEWF